MLKICLVSGSLKITRLATCAIRLGAWLFGSCVSRVCGRQVRALYQQHGVSSLLVSEAAMPCCHRRATAFTSQI